MSAVILTTEAAAWSASDWASAASACRSTRSAAISSRCFSSSVSDAWARSRLPADLLRLAPRLVALALASSR